MRYINYGTIILLLLSFSSCEKALMQPNPTTDHLSIFEEYAKIVTEKFAMLDYKDVDIDFLVDSLRGSISDSSTDTDLFQTLSTIVHRLRDGHSDLTSSTEYAGYDFIDRFPLGFHFGIMFDIYLVEDNPNLKILTGEEGELKIAYGTLPQEENIGYIWIPSWDIELSDEEIETIFFYIRATKGLIVDIRQNTGGDPVLATKFASYLTNKEIYIGFEKFKTGPGPNDFSNSKPLLQTHTQTDSLSIKIVFIAIPGMPAPEPRLVFCQACQES